MYWDNETTPSVSAPLGDFFGNGFDRRHYAALPMGVSSGGFYVYLPMPFHHHARIVVENGTGRPIDAFYYNIDLVESDELPKEVSTFHAWWNRDPRTTSSAPHLVLEAMGQGHFVGLSLNAESHNGRPFHGVVVKDDSLSRIAAYRWHVPDPIPFDDSIRIELEHGHANAEVADYATMAYWYQVEPHAPLPPLPSPDDRRVLAVKIPPGAVPAESLSIMGEKGGGILRLAAPVPRPDLYEVAVYPPGPGSRRTEHGASRRDHRHGGSDASGLHGVLTRRHVPRRRPHVARPTLGSRVERRRPLPQSPALGH
jgi:hypothetical protein